LTGVPGAVATTITPESPTVDRASMNSFTSFGLAAAMPAALLYVPLAMSEIRPEFTGRAGLLKKNWISLFFIFWATMPLISAISSSAIDRFAIVAFPIPLATYGR
jgi:hypothetical protein